MDREYTLLKLRFEDIASLSFLVLISAFFFISGEGDYWDHYVHDNGHACGLGANEYRELQEERVAVFQIDSIFICY